MAMIAREKLGKNWTPQASAGYVDADSADPPLPLENVPCITRTKQAGVFK